MGTGFSDSQAALARIQHNECDPAQTLASGVTVRFLGHDTYSSCKHCASGYVLPFSFVYILTISLYLSCIFFTCTQFMPRMNRQFGRYACMHWAARGRLNHASAQTFPFYPEMTLFFSLLAIFQGQLDSHIFFSCFYGRAGGEYGFVYKALLSLPPRLHACAIQERRQVNHTLPSNIVRISLLLQ